MASWVAAQLVVLDAGALYLPKALSKQACICAEASAFSAISPGSTDSYPGERRPERRDLALV